jgi:hypothetical protein
MMEKDSTIFFLHEIFYDPRKMTWAEHLALMGEIKHTYNIFERRQRRTGG